MMDASETDREAGDKAHADESSRLRIRGQPRGSRLWRALAGTVLARPWFDRAGLIALRHAFFPLSRLWAAARAASGDQARFYAEVPLVERLEDRDRLAHALARFEQARAAVNAIEAEWQRVMLGPEGSSVEYRIATEAARLELRHAYNATRRHFRFLLGKAVPRVKLAVAAPEAVAAIYGSTGRGDPARLFGPPAEMPAVEVSRGIPGVTGTDRWLRFASPSGRLGDIVWARVHEPVGVSDPPTIIYGHGICVEFDHWRGLIDECQAMVRLGFRVVRPEAPWHGRRVPPGRFGGEQAIGEFPTGILDTLTGAVSEWSVLADWARSTSRGPLVFAGSSLGALTSQLAAERASDWPERLRPEALLLITHTGDLAEAIVTGALSSLFASPTEIARHGWTEASVRRTLALLAPQRPLVVPGERIVSVLGRRDVILPFAGGQSLVERWGVRPENLFRWDRGHFSVPMMLVRDDAPLRRLAEIVQGL